MNGEGKFIRNTPKGYEQVTGLTSAKGLTPTAGSRFALITCDGQPVRWRDDGTDPNATVGMYLAVGEHLVYTGHLGKIKFFETGATAVVNVSYYD